MTTIQIEAPAAPTNTAITFITDKATFLTIQSHWKATKEHTAAEHIIYNVIRGVDPLRGFTPIKTAQKIESNACDPWYGYNKALSAMQEMLSTTNPFPRKPEYITEKIVQREATFKKAFGIPLTDEFRAAFPKLENKHG